MKILVTFALETEFAPWRKLREFKRVPVDEGDKAYRARVGDSDLRVFVTGVGRFAVQRAMGIALRETPDVCIVSGLAGGLTVEQRLSVVLAARTVSDARGSKVRYTDSELLELGRSAGATIVERLLTSERVVPTAFEKRQLGVLGEAVDMESAWVFGAATERRVRCAAIRAISDTVDSNLPLDFDRVFDKTGEVSVGSVIGQLAMRPQQLPGLLRLAHQSQRAAAALANFLDKYVQAIETGSLPEYAKADAIAL